MAALAFKVLLPCLSFGAFLGALGFVLYILRGTPPAGTGSTEMEGNNFSLKTTDPVVALSWSAGLVGLVCPVLLIVGFINGERQTFEIGVMGSIAKPSVSVQNPFQGLNFELTRVDPSTGSFSFFVPYAEVPARFDVTGGVFEPITLQVTIDKTSTPARLTISFPTIPSQHSMGPFPIDRGAVDIGTLQLQLKSSESSDGAVNLVETLPSGLADAKLPPGVTDGGQR
jgi:hypothetical protein